jgi:hypothetical protein
MGIVHHGLSDGFICPSTQPRTIRPVLGGLNATSLAPACQKGDTDIQWTRQDLERFCKVAAQFIIIKETLEGILQF